MLTEATFRSDMSVEIADHMGNDLSPVTAARLSTGTETGADPRRDLGLLNYLMRDGHHVPFEHQVVSFAIEAPIFVTRQILKHRMCLSGKTRVMRVDQNGQSVGSTNNEIEKMWELWHVGAKRRHKSGQEFRALLPNRKNMWVRSYDENTLREHTSKVLDIVKNGERETVLVETSNGHKIRTTLDHKFFTPEGWKHLHELSVGDYTYRQGKVAINEEVWIPPRLREGIALWSSSRRRDLIPYSGADCEICGEHHKFEDLELDHIVPVVEDLSKALSDSNLRPLCKTCHREKTDGEQSVRARLGSRQSLVPDQIVSISDPQIEETYDLVLEDPWHNFIAEGLAVHNSSISEESGRYRELPGVFYVPSNDRPVTQIGKTGDYEFVHDTYAGEAAEVGIRHVSATAWEFYQAMLDDGVAKEVARMALPVNTYSKMYVTMNSRALMNFFKLRLPDWGSHPQYEIEDVARQMFQHWTALFPETSRVFLENNPHA